MVLTIVAWELPISDGPAIGSSACASSVRARPSQKKAPTGASLKLLHRFGIARLTIVGTFRRPVAPSTPVGTAVVCENAWAGWWQLAQEIVPSRDRRLSKNSQRPRRTRSGVGGTGSERRLISMPSGGSPIGRSGLSASQRATSGGSGELLQAERHARARNNAAETTRTRC